MGTSVKILLPSIRAELPAGTVSPVTRRLSPVGRVTVVVPSV